MRASHAGGMSQVGMSGSRIAAAARELVGAEVLVIDQDTRVHAGIQQLLSEASLHVTCVVSADAGLALVTRNFYSVVLVDLDTPQPSAGVSTISAIKASSAASMVIALTPRRSYDDVVAAVRAGAVDLILKAPESVAYLQERVFEALGRSLGKREMDTVLDDVRSSHAEFLQRFMESERRATDATDQLAGRDVAALLKQDELRVLIVDEVAEFYTGIVGLAPPGYTFVHASSAGEALDRVSTGPFHYALVAQDLTDLPATTVARTIRNQYPDVVVMTFRGPSDNGYIDLIETSGTRRIVEDFIDAGLLASRLDELAEAWRAKARERRYLQAFRERHYDFLRRYVELKTKIERALNDGPG